MNLYAYTYEGAMKKLESQGYMLVKIGDSHRKIETRMREQGGAAEYEPKITVGGWMNLEKIDRDYRVHELLKRRGLYWEEGGLGTEWFRIPAQGIQEARQYIDQVVTRLEGRRVRVPVRLRSLQQRALDQALDIIAAGAPEPSIIANLCPRFGKTIWALMLFNQITRHFGNRVMLLPAYWLSVHSSFIKELDEFNDFLDIREVSATESGAAELVETYLAQNLRVVIPISLHGELPDWCMRHAWIQNLNLDDLFVFADEGDFGTHTENQVAKLNFLLER